MIIERYDIMNSMMKTIWLFLLLTTAFLFMAECSTDNSIKQNPTVRTQYGFVKGKVSSGSTIIAFKGIPYAAPHIGNLRWREPQPPAAWEGVRDASEFSSSCIQNKLFTHVPNGPWSEAFMVQNDVSEDCLFLNIWTPAISAKDKLPVFVYIHGGAFREGSGAIDVYDGEELAKKGIIVITINYRLGPFGFLAHPELTAESPHHSSGNYGFLDQLAALKWIKNNITAFGGDPSCVTIAGQSAGASSVRALIASPLAKDLFHRAITQSGSSFAGGRGRGSITLSAAEKQSVEFATLKGAASIAELRALSADNILASTQPPMRSNLFKKNRATFVKKWI